MSPQGSLEPSFHLEFYMEPFGLLNHIETYKIVPSKCFTLNNQTNNKTSILHIVKKVHM